MFVFILKQYPQNFAFLILRNFELFAREVYTFLKKANFQHILFFLNVCKQTFHIYHIYHFAHTSKSKRCFNVKSPAYYFHIKTNTMADFQICISVPLINQELYFSCFQKKPSTSALRKSCSENMQQIYKRTPMPKRDLCSLVNLLHIFRPPFPKNTCGQLFLCFPYFMRSCILSHQRSMIEIGTIFMV